MSGFARLLLLACVLLPARALGQTSTGPYTITPLTIASGATAMAIVPAAPFARNYATICNYTAVGGSVLFCRQDGGAPGLNLGIGIYPAGVTATQYCKTWYSSQVSPMAINCACVGLTSCIVGGEYNQ